MHRSALALACVAVALIAPPSAISGGWWTSIRLDRTRVAVGQEMTVHASVMFRSIDAAEAAQKGGAQGEFYVYLLRGFDYSLVQRAMRKPSPQNWWTIGAAEAFRAGRVVIDRQESNLGVAEASFRVPDVPTGRYAVMFCDEACTHPLADVIPTLPKQLTVTARPTAGTTQWVQSFGWLVIGAVVGVPLGFALCILGRPASHEPEPVAAGWPPSDERELEELSRPLRAGSDFTRKQSRRIRDSNPCRRRERAVS
jgi:hypothetical protein